MQVPELSRACWVSTVDAQGSVAQRERKTWVPIPVGVDLERPERDQSYS